MIGPGVVPATDLAARGRIRSSLSESMIVEASAGTGKTSELVRRLVAVLASGAGRIQNVAAVTFTHKAAGELKLRLRQGLDEARRNATDAAEAANLEHAIQHLEEAVIGTIHSFCARILRERPVEAVVDPAFEEMAEAESQRMFSRAFRTWLEGALNQPLPGLRRALARLAWRDSPNDLPPAAQLRMEAWKIAEWRDFPAPWRRPEFDREAGLDQLLNRAGELDRLSQNPRRADDRLYRALGPLGEFLSRIERSEAAAPRDYDVIEALLPKLAEQLRKNSQKGAGQYGADASREVLLGLREELIGAIEALERVAGADLAALLRDELSAVTDTYAALKARAGKLDFTDLLIKVRDLIAGNREVREYLQARFSHLFVDEFQDIDPLQVEILLLLASDAQEETDWRRSTPAAGKLFVVGDPKQSIYKFRRADLGLYREASESLVGRGVGLARLTRSFRAVAPIQEFVNAAFSSEMLGNLAAGEAVYSPLEEGDAPLRGQPSVVALPAPRPYGGNGQIANKAIDACLPDAIAAYVEWLVNQSGWQVREPGASSTVPIKPGHIAILFRRLVNNGGDLTRVYQRALESRDIPHLLVGSRSFHEREEVETIRNALTAIEWPDDELSVFATLKGSLFALPDGLLLRYQSEAGRLQPFRPALAGTEMAPVGEALGVLAELHRGRNRRAIADTLNRLLEAARAHAGFAFRQTGVQTLANVGGVLALARQFETGGGVSFRAFVEELGEQIGKTESSDAPLLEEGAEGVRLMTVHSAKGLEFPVVILADMTAKLNSPRASRHIDDSKRLCAMEILRCSPLDLLDASAEELAKERAEGVRLAYVAATRARDLLVVSACGDECRDGWLGPLNKALYPDRGRWRESTQSEGCPEFGGSSVLERPIEMSSSPESSVKPGSHRAAGWRHEVVWWDPATLHLHATTNFGLAGGLNGLELLKEGGSSEGIDRYRQWKSARESAIEQGHRPSLEVFSATEAQVPPEAIEVAIVPLSKTRGRASGRRFGTLVHAILRDVPLDADRRAVESLAQIQSRTYGATPEETLAAVDAVVAALAHELVQNARGAQRIERESPVVLPISERRWFEGVVDLAYFDGNLWTVVDFKTDADLAQKRSAYERQIQWYAYALRSISGEPVKAWLLAV